MASVKVSAINAVNVSGNLFNQLNIMENHVTKEFRTLRNGGYHAVHKWLENHYGKANKCENPQCEGLSNKYHWSKLRDKPYKHDRKNFWMLCAKCHRNYDITGKEIKRLKTINIGKAHTSEHIEKIKSSTRGKINLGNQHSIKTIQQYDKEGKLIKEYPSLTIAAKEMKTSISNISYALDGTYKTAKKFIWKYRIK